MNPVQRKCVRVHPMLPIVDIKTALQWLMSGNEIQQISSYSRVPILGNRIQTFTKGVNCVDCSAKGSHFQIEQHTHQTMKRGKWHLNLYAVNQYGHHVLMTSDHIIPKAHGGSNLLINRQPMCTKCNHKKGASLESFYDFNTIFGVASFYN